MQKKKSVNINYVPHNEYRHVETRRTEEDYEEYLENLSRVVSVACDKWLRSKGLSASVCDEVYIGKTFPSKNARRNGPTKSPDENNQK